MVSLWLLLSSCSPCALRKVGDCRSIWTIFRYLGVITAIVGEKIALSRRVDKHWRLIGWGEIRKGVKITMNEPFRVEAGDVQLN
jgi:translation initiation factor 2 gamma subunit (eIF-2gamma)